MRLVVNDTTRRVRLEKSCRRLRKHASVEKLNGGGQSNWGPNSICRLYWDKASFQGAYKSSMENDVLPMPIKAIKA